MSNNPEWTKELEKQLLDNPTNGMLVYKLTKDIDQCPEDWDGPCLCRGCQGCGD